MTTISGRESGEDRQTSRRRRRRAATAPTVVALSLFLIALTTGCTTVTRTALTSTGAGDKANGTGLGAGGAADGGTAGGAASPGQASAGAQSGSTGAAPGSTSSGAAGGGASAGSSSTGGAAAAGPGSGCSQIIKIGTTYSSDEGQVLTALGNSEAGSEVSQGNYVQEMQALYQRMADYVNTHGGLAGCKMQFVYYDFQFADPNGESDNSQNECSKFAEDDHAFAVMNEQNENKTLITCLAEHKVITLYGGGLQYRPIPQDFTQYRGYLYQPNIINPYRFKPMIDLLNQGGYFGSDPSKAKVGILLADDGSGSNQYLVDNLWKPALAALGIANPEVFTFFQCTTVANCSTTTNQFQSAVLQFRSKGVDHVLYTPDGGDAAFFFTQVAHSQGYTPRYGMTTDSGPALWNTEPDDQRPNAMAVSFELVDLFPAFDQKEMATVPPNPTRQACDSIYKQAYPSRYEAYYGICDNILFLQAALKGASSVTAPAVLAGAERLGNSFPLANGYGNAAFAPPNHYDGGTTTRVILWNEAEQKWQFVSGATAIP